MASQSEPFFEHSRFGQKKRPQANAGYQQEQAASFIKDSWREDFRFSDDLATLEHHQNIQLNDPEMARYYQQATQHQNTYAQARPAAHVSGNSAAALPRSPQEAQIIQANHILALEQQIMQLQAENTELIQDNQIMARQLHAFFDDTAAESIDDEERKTVAKKSRYQKIWGKLHLLL